MGELELKSPGEGFLAAELTIQGGDGVALEGSTSAPLPQGIWLPSEGCVIFGGGVLSPVAEAMVKRVVQVWFDALAEEY